MTIVTHKIEKVLVEVSTYNLETATKVKNYLSSFLKDEFFPKIEHALDEYNQTGRVVRINSLNLNISTPPDINFNSFNEEIVKQFSEQIRLEIDRIGRNSRDKMFDSGIHIIPDKDNCEEIFLFFLDNGYLPWFGTEKEIAECLAFNNWQKSLAEPDFVDRITKVLRNDKANVDRFVYQLEKDALMVYLFKINPGLKKTESDIQKIIQSLPRKQQQLFLQLLLVESTAFDKSILIQTANQFSESLKNLVRVTSLNKMVGSEALTITFQNTTRRKNDELIKRLEALFTRFLNKSGTFITEEKKIFADTILYSFRKDTYRSDDFTERGNDILKESYEKDEKNQETVFELRENEVALQNAGLVLLHPFLKSFFKEIDLLNGNGQIKTYEQQTAVQTLHFLATGKEEFFEGNLILEKFICGIPLKTPIQRENLLSEKIKAESLLLLQEVIRQWPALKKTSPDGLRQMFIQRDGKLYHQENNYKLIVEQKPQDVLLEKLNWNVSVVKIPWRKELLFVEWN